MAKRRKGLKGRIDEELERLSRPTSDVEEAIEVVGPDSGPIEPGSTYTRR